ncbi:hypothetical protein ACFFGY_17700 [Roseomonas elaeocarpi]|uniref:Polysaccharide chain length determinant N-terminal domain-containing protein n=1 Tax=Roseomonas elaeocarpi TaxID=907779 RepID=A0ABV6JWI8_9PROT
MLHLLWRLRWRMAVVAAVILALGITLVLLWPRQYVASAVIAPAETTGLATSTLIQSNAVLQTGSLLDNRPGGNFAVYLALLRSPEAAAMLARDTRLPQWLTQQRGAGLMGWVRDTFGLRITSDSDDLERWLERNLAVTQSLSAVTVTLELPHPDREVALDALTRLHAFAEDKVRADLAELAARRTATLQDRLARERDVYLRTPLYDLLAQHQRASLVLLADTAVAARLVSAPSVDLAPTLPNRPLLIVLLLVAVPLATVLGSACLVLLRLPDEAAAGAVPPGPAPPAAMPGSQAEPHPGGHRHGGAWAEPVLRGPPP